MFRYFFDALPGDDPELRQRNIFRAINDRPYIGPEEIFAIMGADRNKIGIGDAVIILC